VARSLTADPVYLALTRPAMIAGVTYAGVLVNAVVTLEAFLLTKNLALLLLALPIHACLWLACLVEPRCFELWLAWGRTSARGWFANRRGWRANSYSPLPLAMRRRREVTCRT
jgi:type IV secretion system protein VirB3